jgi:hypothetical protein
MAYAERAVSQMAAIRNCWLIRARKEQSYKEGHQLPKDFDG